MDTQTGMPTGPPAAEHWPRGKGYWDQPAPFVDGANELRSEWSHLDRTPKAKKPPPKKAAPPKRTSRRR